jgi:hypothetical protein
MGWYKRITVTDHVHWDQLSWQTTYATGASYPHQLVLHFTAELTGYWYFCFGFPIPPEERYYTPKFVSGLAFQFMTSSNYEAFN